MAGRSVAQQAPLISASFFFRALFEPSLVVGAGPAILGRAFGRAAGAFAPA
jgi:hypothetical protein